ncbi:MAG: 30S ribosomal protein S8 [Deltaproteobacteria bacterium RIFCSPLOWO2_02_FULL_44_10]|nr:MAG: 30S ribosomal protein S8 [Deltaproteobacteria bacterium RIFCSPHIGHO2_02_FULL_44_16]OGQ45575.1 MAG: 30S ribosomal protein S8 [Deltaproteobacteria bacterium RIFCSPLOWO2_02_FULL_44_10]
MSLNDPISDLLTRIRNASRAKHDDVLIPYSKMKESFVRVLAKEGFFDGVDVIGEGIRKQIVVQLRYTQDRKPILLNIRRMSKPGRRVYLQCTEIKSFRQGMGVSLFSTPKGILTDQQALEARVGGEILCTVW